MFSTSRMTPLGMRRYQVAPPGSDSSGESTPAGVLASAWAPDVWALSSTSQTGPQVGSWTIPTDVNEPAGITWNISGVNLYITASTGTAEAYAEINAYNFDGFCVHVRASYVKFINCKFDPYGLQSYAFIMGQSGGGGPWSGLLVTYCLFDGKKATCDGAGPPTPLGVYTVTAMTQSYSNMSGIEFSYNRFVDYQQHGFRHDGGNDFYFHHNYISVGGFAMGGVYDADVGITTGAQTFINFPNHRLISGITFRSYFQIDSKTGTDTVSGLSVGTRYYAQVVDADNFRITNIAGVDIATTGSPVGATYRGYGRDRVHADGCYIGSTMDSRMHYNYFDMHPGSYVSEVDIEGATNSMRAHAFVTTLKVIGLDIYRNISRMSNAVPIGGAGADAWAINPIQMAGAADGPTAFDGVRWRDNLFEEGSGGAHYYPSPSGMSESVDNRDLASGDLIPAEPTINGSTLVTYSDNSTAIWSDRTLITWSV